MSHPYFPQGLFMYRRRKGSPSLPSYGSYEGVTDPVVKAQPIAAKTFAAGRGATPNAGISAVYARRTMGSLSPKTEWATPSYVRDERSGVGFGDQQFMTSTQPFATAQYSSAVGSGQCFEVVWSRIKELAKYVADKMPYGLSSIMLKLLSNRLAALDKAVFQRIYNGWTAAGGTAEFRKVLVQEQVWLLSLFPNDLLTAVNAAGGGLVSIGIDQLADFVAEWVDEKIRSCMTPPDPSQSADALNAAVCNPNPTQTGEICCGGGIFLKYQQRCAATQEDYATGLQIEQVLMTQQMMKGGVSPTFQAALPGISFAKALTTAQINAGFGTKLTAGLVQVKGQINPIFAKNCVSGGGVAYLDAAGWQKCAPIGTVVPGSGVPPVATSSKTTMFLIGAAIVGIALLAGKKKGQ